MWRELKVEYEQLDLLHDVPDVASTCNFHEPFVHDGVSFIHNERIWKPDVVPEVHTNVVQSTGARKRKPWITPGLSQIQSHGSRLYIDN